MLYMDMPLVDKLKSPLTFNVSYLGGNGDGFIYTGTQYRIKVNMISLTYEKLTYTEAETVLSALESYVKTQPARLRLKTKSYALTKVQQKRGIEQIELTIELQETF
jgi:hypothetical protein